MAALHIERSHALGLARSRHLVRRWVEEAQRTLELRCTVHSGPHGEVVEFTRAGVTGRLEAGADRLVLDADLGWTFMLLHGRIQREIEAQVDALLAAEAQQLAAAAPKRPKSPAASGRTAKASSSAAAKHVPRAVAPGAEKAARKAAGKRAPKARGDG
jgi:putative polyhydroxyalkanoate system protein